VCPSHLAGNEQLAVLASVRELLGVFRQHGVSAAVLQAYAYSKIATYRNGTVDGAPWLRGWAGGALEASGAISS
jgi:hypothetical protein